MKLYSTNDAANIVELREAVLQSLPADKGLYMPAEIPVLSNDFIDNIEGYSFPDIAYRVASALIGDYIPEGALRGIIDRSIDFAAPVVMHDDNIGTLELFHGPSLAFKDFGARFMAELISYFMEGEGKRVTILVATSGDTGGAVAAGFYQTPGIEVIILYPEGKVSDLQEKQLTTLGQNIYALEIKGTFDDCQAMVKEAFLDNSLSLKYNLSSANSINIARLIPQTFYYFEAYRQVKKYSRKVTMAVPSGNFGNLTAGLIAKRMGLPIEHFIAATNINKVVPDYLRTGEYQPIPSVATISNAMDVGSPSNFTRMLALYEGDHARLSADVSGYHISDVDDRRMMREIYDRYGYVADPHGAIGYAALRDYLVDRPDQIGIYLETAHPAKFLDVVDDVLPVPCEIPDRLQEIADLEKRATKLPANYATFRDWLLAR